MSARELLRCTLYVIITSSVVFVAVTVPCLLQTCSTTNSWTLEECHGHSDHGVSENTKTVDREGKSMSTFVAHSTIVMRIGRLQLPLKFIYASTRDLGCHNRRQMRTPGSWDGVERVLWESDLGDLNADAHE
jgi:hypothetical protein